MRWGWFIMKNNGDCDFLVVNVGSISANLAIIDDNRNVIETVYILTKSLFYSRIESSFN